MTERLKRTRQERRSVELMSKLYAKLKKETKKERAKL